MRGSKTYRWCGKTMKERRTEIGLSLQDIGTEIGTARTYVWEIEDGSQPTIGFAYHIAKILKKPISFFLEEC